MSDVEVLVKMILYQCREKGTPITEPLAAFLIKIAQNPC